MFKEGSLWIPPTKNIYTAGMPDHVFEMSLNEDNTVENTGSKKSGKSERQTKKVEEIKKKNNGLSDSQRDRFEDMLRNLLPDRNPIGKNRIKFSFKGNPNFYRKMRNSEKSNLFCAR